jgi:hypothetical protein
LLVATGGRQHTTIGLTRGRANPSDSRAFERHAPS